MSRNPLSSVYFTDAEMRLSTISFSRRHFRPASTASTAVVIVDTCCPAPRRPTMNLQQLVILLPCHSFEDFPQHHRGDDAAGLLAGWTALWHPSLLAAANRAGLVPR